MQTITHKMGSSFSMAVSVNTDVTTWGIKSQIRKLDGSLLSDLLFTMGEVTEEGSSYTLSCLNTETWPEGKYLCDIQYTDPDDVITCTETFQVNVVRAVTK